MKYLELSFIDPASNLACDEALLQWFEDDRPADALLRIWEPKNHFVVLGHSNRLAAEINIAACAADNIPILRRMSGGGAVLQGPGCLNYSLILNSVAHGLKGIAETFRYVLERNRQLVGALAGVEASIEGISDLALAGRKFSGNAQYRKARFVLVHGTFLVNFDLAALDRCLRCPERQPEYRRHRPHHEFVTNLEVDPRRLRQCLRDGWHAEETLSQVPLDQIANLVKHRYASGEWSAKF